MAHNVGEHGKAESEEAETGPAQTHS